MTHLHILVLFHKQFGTRNRSAFDFVCGKHGNYQPAKHQFAVVNYLQKSDRAPLSYGEIPNPALKTGRSKGKKGGSGSPSESKSTTYAQALLSGSSTLQEIMIKDPGYYMLKKRWLEEFDTACRFQQANASKQSWPTEWTYSGESPETQRIAEWLKSNIGVTRSLRQKQLFVHGPKEYCKSTVIELLRAFFRLYEITKAEDFYDFYDDRTTDIAYMDEFKGQKQIQWLNQFLDGSWMTLRKKGSQCIKMKNLPVIILSNFPLEQCYAGALAKDPNKLDTLQSRLEVIELRQPFDSLGLALALGLTEETFTAMKVWKTWNEQCELALAKEAAAAGIVIQCPPPRDPSPRPWKKRKTNFCAFCGMTEANCRCKAPQEDEE